LPESKIQAILGDLDACYTKWTENTFPGLLGNVVSGRVANRFDLKGTNCVLDAACASSLAAVKMAVQELQLGTADMVVTGGADALNDIFMYMCFSKTTALSPSEDCRPFSEAGDGTVLGEGVAMMTLKRLEDAERDGDRIYAVISAIGSSSDGRSGSIYAPDSNGQSLAIRRAYEDAGFTPDQIGLVEAHGTGTMAGDYAEFQGLKLGYGETEARQYCALGSVKSMIGHTKSAAGAASVLKVAMALNNAILPPTIKVDRPNPKLNIEESPFYLNTRARPWIQPAGISRKAGVSSMGFGGTNFHVAMEAYEPAERRPAKLYRPGRELLLFSAESPQAIIQALGSLEQEGLNQDLVQLAKATQTAFDPAHTCRLAIMAADLPEVFKWAAYATRELANKPASLEVPNSVFYAEGNAAGQVAFLFAGQGSQYLNMGIDLLMQYEQALQPWNQAAGLDWEGHKRLHEVVYPVPVFTEAEKQAQADLLVQTQWAQPAIGALALSHFNLLQKLQIRPQAVGGHSYGEVAALFAAGMISSEEDLMRISRKRGELMAGASSGKGAMTAVFASAETVSLLLSQAATPVVIANVNSPAQTVISGPAAEIEKIEPVLSQAGLRFQRLHVSTAFHSELVAGSATAFEAYLKQVKFGKAQVPVYANTTAAPYPDKTSGYARVLARQLAAPVQFQQQVQAMHAAGIRVFVELGPGKVLGNFVRDILGDKPHRAISIDGGRKVNSKDAFWTALAQLAVAGVPAAFPEIWKNLDDNKKAVPLKKPSVAAVKINGSNYGKPYPPQGGFKSLPGPNPEPALPAQTGAPAAPVPAAAPAVRAAPATSAVSIAPAGHPAPAGEKPAPLPAAGQVLPRQEAPAPAIKNESISTYKIEQKNTMTGVNNNWLQAFQEIQKNTLEAQKNFQDTLAQSHRLFLETSQMAFHSLGKLSGFEALAPQAVGAYGAQHQLPAGPGHQVPAPASLPAAPQPILIAAPAPQAPAAVAAPALQAPAPVALPLAYQPAAPSAPAVPASASVPVNFEDSLLRIVADKTGYPQEILDLDTDLESGLGIDSIKRVEILSALQAQFPALKGADTARLAAMNTLGEILAFAKASEPAPTPATPAQVSGSLPAAIAAISESAPGQDLENFVEVMLQIVADKTGYPKEILDLDTDLESGLGIDSIKRVEILSALQAQFPALKGADTARLAALNTLGEILGFAGDQQITGAGGVAAGAAKK
ncbi:MAG: acyltransferase domain-containing protein, partial [Adhaeribacter sp.]